MAEAAFSRMEKFDCKRDTAAAWMLLLESYFAQFKLDKIYYDDKGYSYELLDKNV